MDAVDKSDRRRRQVATIILLEIKWRFAELDQVLDYANSDDFKRLQEALDRFLKALED